MELMGGLYYPPDLFGTYSGALIVRKTASIEEHLRSLMPHISDFATSLV